MNNLIQAITAYTTALEQKLSALETRVALLETESGKLKTKNEALEAQIATLQAEVAALEATGVAIPTTDPEVEIELIVEEDAETENGEVKTENELVEEPQEEPQEELEQLEPLDILEEPEAEETEVEPTIEPKPMVEPAPAPQPEVTAEPIVASQPVSRPMPQQTSLFGTAVEDIRQAISLGDRFLFQRELFAGNGELMQKTLDEINSLGSLSEAMDYVLDNFEWDKESTAVQLFENVLKRRFA